MNIFIAKGRLTSEPELKQTGNGLAVAKFTIAIPRRFDKEATDFINCTAWRNTAEFIAKNFTKGQEILCEGEINIDKYQADTDTVKYFTDFVVSRAEFCGSKKDNSPTKGSLVADENKYELINDDFIGNLLQDEVDLSF